MNRLFPSLLLVVATACAGAWIAAPALAQEAPDGGGDGAANTELARRVDSLVEDMGSADFQRREEAFQEALGLPREAADLFALHLTPETPADLELRSRLEGVIAALRSKLTPEQERGRTRVFTLLADLTGKSSYGTGDPEFREVVEMGGDAVPWLLEIIRNRRVRDIVRWYALEAVERIVTGPDVDGRVHLPALVQTLRAEGTYLSRNLATLVKQLGGTSVALPVVIANRNHADPDVRAGSLNALYVLQGVEAREHLLRGLDDPDAEVRRAAASSLINQEFGDAAVRALVRALEDTDERVRQTAAGRASILRDPAIVEPLLDSMADPDPSVRRSAANAVSNMALSGMFDPPASGEETDEGAALAARVEEALTGLLEDSDPYARGSAVRALGRLWSNREGEARDEARTLLRELAADPEPQVRRNALQALVTLKDPEVFPLLERAMTDEKADRSLRSYVVNTLQDVARQGRNAEEGSVAADQAARALDLIRRALEDEDSNVVTQAVYALSNLRDTASGPAIADLARRTLDTIEQEEAVIEAQRDRDDPDQEAVETATAELNRARSILQAASYGLQVLATEHEAEILERMLGSERSYVRSNALRGLARTAPDRLRGRLAELLADTDVAIVRSACDAAAQVGDPSLAPILVELLGHGDGSVVRSAAQALGNMAGQVRSADDEELEASITGALADVLWPPGSRTSPGEPPPGSGDMWADRAAAQALQNYGDSRGVQALVVVERRRTEMNPDDAGAWQTYARLVHQTGNWEESAKAYGRLVELQPQVNSHHYNHACALARAGRTDEALDALEKAWSMGWRDRDHMNADEDLDNLRETERFRSMIEDGKILPPADDGDGDDERDD